MLMPILSALILLTALGGCLVLAVPASRQGLARLIALAAALLVLILTVALFLRFDSGAAEMQFVEHYRWIRAGSIHIDYHVGIDGISLMLILLTAVMTPLAMLGSWKSVQERVKPFFALLLFLQAGIIGVFAALDLMLFYFFWELTLVPMYFLIGIWGYERRIYAAVKFFLYTMAGSLLMLAAIIALYFFNGATTFSLPEIAGNVQQRSLLLPAAVEVPLFLAFFLAFAIKIPIFPLHTWLPDAHVEAPTAGSVLLASILLKMGAYGLIRFCLPLFPRSCIRLAPAIVALALIGIIYGALVAMVQPDLKKLIAYSSVSHLGFVVLGIFSFNNEGLMGANYQMLTHGVTTGALFLLVGILYERRHTRQISDFGGIAHVIPVYSSFFLLTTLASIGLPGLNGFVGEWLVLQGTFLVSPRSAALAATAMILSATYMLWMYQRVFFGNPSDSNRRVPDLKLREYAILVPAAVLMIWMGMYSATFLRRMDTATARIVSDIEAVRQQISPTIYRVSR
ncbi:MAG: NADH-quinone oxidoreductase subunit M [Acidobacteria bacterium]|nr:NADH-quinone oxidoreductase subunit M [Acidobacteriota bacterium]